MKTPLIIAIPKFSLIAMISKKPIILVGTVPTIAVAKIVDFESVAWILLGLFFSDLVTGLLASYFTWQKDPEKKERWFFGKGEGFSSDKFKKMFFKAIVYIALPLLLIQFQQVLMLKNIKYERVSEAEFDLATIAIIVFCLNEGFSIFHENLPKCGFNLWQSLKKMIGFVKEVKKEFKEE